MGEPLEDRRLLTVVPFEVDSHQSEWAVAASLVGGIAPLTSQKLSEEQIATGPQTIMDAVSVVTWSGGGDGHSWNDAANWTDLEVPGSTDDVVIDVAGSPTIDLSGNISVQSLNSSDPIDILEGSLAVTSGSSQLTGGLTVSSGASLTVAGSGTTFDVTGTTVIDGASLYVQDGGSLSMPAATSYSGIVGGTSMLEASGAGSSLSLPNLATIAEDTTSYESVADVLALSGGTVSLTGLTQINLGPVVLESDGDDSLLDISALTTFQGPSGQAHASIFQATLGGTVNTILSNTDHVNLTLDFSGDIDYGLLTSFTNGIANINQGHVLYGNLTDIDGSSFQLSGGATLNMPAVTSYSGALGVTSTLQASGVGSLLSLPNLTTITGDTGNFVSLTQAQALSGGQVSLPALTQIGGGPVALVADGTGSQLDVSALTSFQGAGGQYHTTSFQVTNGGTLLDALLTTLSGVTVTLDGSGTLATSQWTAFTNATAAISGGNPDFSSLANINGAGFQVSGGATVSLPTVTSYSGPIGDAIKLQASGVGSLLSLPNLTTITGDTGNFVSLTQAQALSGGQVSLPALTQIGGGPVALVADGTGSQLDVSALTSFQGARRPISHDKLSGHQRRHAAGCPVNDSQRCDRDAGRQRHSGHEPVDRLHQCYGCHQWR